jgi:hypothetical protein
MPKRVVLTPLKQGSRAPEEFREAARKVVAERDVATWRKVKEWEADPEEPLTEADPPPMTAAQPSGKLRPMKKLVLLEPAVRPPNRALIQAAVEKVVGERKRREAAEKAAARRARLSRSSAPAQQG